MKATITASGQKKRNAAEEVRIVYSAGVVVARYDPTDLRKDRESQARRHDRGFNLNVVPSDKPTDVDHGRYNTC
jgi:hypothetical protein